MAELQKINDYLAGDVNLNDIDYIVVKAGDANFFQVTGGAHFFGVDGDNNLIYNLWLDSDGKLVSEDANGHKDVVAYIDNNKLQVVYGRHTDPYNGLSQPVTVTLDGTEDKGKSLLNAFKGYADTWFNNLFVPRVKEISVEVAVAAPDVKVTSLTGLPSSLTLKVGDNGSLSATVVPDNATNKDVEYTVSGTGITLTGNNYVATGEGTPTIVATAKGGDNVTVSIPVTITAA